MKKKMTLFTATLLLLALCMGGCSKNSTDATTSATKKTESNDVAGETTENTSENANEDSANSEETENADDTSVSQTVYPLTIETYGPDGTLYTQTFNEAPSKVITNNASSTDLLLELGLEDKIAGILSPDNAPLEKWAATYENLNVLGDKKTVSKEVIIGNEPDLIFGRAAMLTDDSMGSIEAYNEMGIPVYTQLASNFVVEQSLENIITDVRTIGQIFDVSEKADAYADSLEERLSSIEEKVSNLPESDPIRVLFMVAYNDGTFNTFGANSALQTVMLDTLHAVNVLETGTSSLTHENLLVLNPDVIVYITSDRNAATDAAAVDTLLADDMLQSIPAISNEKIITIGYDAIMDYGTRIFDTLEELHAFLYEE